MIATRARLLRRLLALSQRVSSLPEHPLAPCPMPSIYRCPRSTLSTHLRLYGHVQSTLHVARDATTASSQLNTSNKTVAHETQTARQPLAKEPRSENAPRWLTPKDVRTLSRTPEGVAAVQAIWKSWNYADPIERAAFRKFWKRATDEEYDATPSPSLLYKRAIKRIAERQAAHDAELMQVSSPTKEAKVEPKQAASRPAPPAAPGPRSLASWRKR